MEKGLVITTNPKKFKEVLDEHTDKIAGLNRKRKIVEKYLHKYPISGEVATIHRRQIHVDYLPTIDVLLEIKKRYEHPIEVAGAALFKIERDHCLCLTDSEDPNLQRVYQANKRKADKLASRLSKMNTEEFDYQFSHVLAQVLSGSFECVFSQNYGDWRRSLA